MWKNTYNIIIISSSLNENFRNSSAVPGSIKSSFEEILSSLDGFQPTEHGH